MEWEGSRMTTWDHRQKLNALEKQIKAHGPVQAPRCKCEEPLMDRRHEDLDDCCIRCGRRVKRG